MADLANFLLNQWKDRAQKQGWTPSNNRRWTGFGQEAAQRQYGGAAKRQRAGKPDSFGQGQAGGRKNPMSSVGDIFDQFITERGWEKPTAVGSVMGRWPELVGPQIAAHCQVESFEDSTLVLRTESTTWATQLKHLRFQILHRLAEELGPDVVTEIKIFGPYQNRWGKGPQWVRGRGPRDTYG